MDFDEKIEVKEMKIDKRNLFQEHYFYAFFAFLAGIKHYGKKNAMSTA